MYHVVTRVKSPPVGRSAAGRRPLREGSRRYVTLTGGEPLFGALL